MARLLQLLQEVSSRAWAGTQGWQSSGVGSLVGCSIRLAAREQRFAHLVAGPQLSEGNGHVAANRSFRNEISATGPRTSTGSPNWGTRMPCEPSRVTLPSEAPLRHPQGKKVSPDLRIGHRHRTPGLTSAWRKSGTMLPSEPSTFPSRIDFMRVPLEPILASRMSSAIRFEAPMMLTGSTALSVETRINCSSDCLGGLHQQAGPDCIVLDGRKGILLHDRDVLESGRVVHSSGGGGGGIFRSAGRIGDVAQYRHAIDTGRHCSRAASISYRLRSAASSSTICRGANSAIGASQGGTDPAAGAGDKDSLPV